MMRRCVDGASTGPCSPTYRRDMSLFHDFKLKRRKVDSRCSTEGDAIGEMTNLPAVVSESVDNVQHTQDTEIGSAGDPVLNLKRETLEVDSSEREAETKDVKMEIKLKESNVVGHKLPPVVIKQEFNRPELKSQCDSSTSLLFARASIQEKNPFQGRTEETTILEVRPFNDSGLGEQEDNEAQVSVRSSPSVACTLPPSIYTSKLYNTLSQPRNPNTTRSSVQITVQRGASASSNTFPRPAESIYQNRRISDTVQMIKTEGTSSVQIIPRSSCSLSYKGAYITPQPGPSSTMISPQNLTNPSHILSDEDRKVNILSAMQEFINKNQQYSMERKTSPPNFPAFPVPFPPHTLSSTSPADSPTTVPSLRGLPFAIPAYSMMSPQDVGRSQVNTSTTITSRPSSTAGSNPIKKEEKPSSSGIPGTAVYFGHVGGVRTMMWSPPKAKPSATITSSFGVPDTTRRSIDSEHEMQAVKGLVELGQTSATSQPPVSIFNTSEIFGNPVPSTSSARSNFIPNCVQQAPTDLSTTEQRPRLPRQHIDMAELWAGNLEQLPPQAQPSSGFLSGDSEPSNRVSEDDNQPMICMICDDKATGLHYGIITCEGCKGFFKRTVQNKRIYSCVAEGDCEITKAQRNRCQFCRFQKCLLKGMVLAAVREDRMPGGRNSGAVYNMYKVKYKKHKKHQPQPKKPAVPPPPSPYSMPSQVPTQPALPMVGFDRLPLDSPKSLYNLSDDQTSSSSMNTSASAPASPRPDTHLPPSINILKAVLTGSQEVLPQYRTAERSRRRERYEECLRLIQELLDCDEFEDISTLEDVTDLLVEGESDLSEKLCRIGDRIVYKLVQWTRRLPFYEQIPVHIHTDLLTNKWHELLVLTTCSYHSIRGIRKNDASRSDEVTSDLHEEICSNLTALQTSLTTMMGRQITMNQLQQDVGIMVEKITRVIQSFKYLGLTLHEYVCLKVITMITTEESIRHSELRGIYDCYMSCLRVFCDYNFPNQPSRVQQLLVKIPEVREAAELLLESKMFYVPFLLNSSINNTHRLRRQQSNQHPGEHSHENQHNQDSHIQHSNENPSSYQPSPVPTQRQSPGPPPHHPSTGHAQSHSPGLPSRHPSPGPSRRHSPVLLSRHHSPGLAQRHSPEPTYHQPSQGAPHHPSSGLTHPHSPGSSHHLGQGPPHILTSRPSLLASSIPSLLASSGPPHHHSVATSYIRTRQPSFITNPGPSHLSPPTGPSYNPLPGPFHQPSSGPSHHSTAGPNHRHLPGSAAFKGPDGPHFQ